MARAQGDLRADRAALGYISGGGLLRLLPRCQRLAHVRHFPVGGEDIAEADFGCEGASGSGSRGGLCLCRQCRARQ